MFPFSLSLSLSLFFWFYLSWPHLAHRFAARIATGLPGIHQTWLPTQCFSRKCSMSCVQLAVLWHSFSTGWWPGKVMGNVWTFISTLTGFLIGGGLLVSLVTVDLLGHGLEPNRLQIRTLTALAYWLHLLAPVTGQTISLTAEARV